MKEMEMEAVEVESGMLVYVVAYPANQLGIKTTA